MEVGGAWYWLRSPEQEKRVVISIFNRYCLRCHAVDGRGVWDIPDVPNFTNARWQASRTDAQLARAILEGRYAASVDDVRALAMPTLQHRMVLNFHAESQGMKSPAIVDKLIASVKA